MLPAVLTALQGAGGAAAGGMAAGEAGGMAGLGQAAGQMQQLSGSAQSLAGGLGKLNSPLGLLELGAKKLYAAINFLPSKILEVKEMIVSTGQNLVQALAAPITTVKQLGDALGQFVRLADPSALRIFEFRVENTFATIGNILRPVFESLSRAAEKMGDLFAKLKPALEPFMQAISELIDAIADDFSEIMQMAAPIIQAFGYAILGLVRVMVALGRPLMMVVRLVNDLNAALGKLLGVKIGVDRDAKSDIAVREPRYASTYDIYKEAARNSLMSSFADKDKKPKTTEGWLEQIHKFLTENLTAEKLQRVVAVLRDMLPGLPKGGLPSSPLDAGRALLGALRTES